MAPTLLVLAAGMGSRYGGLKQIEPVGPGGETVLDYAVFDARRAGFGRVVFVIRKDFEAVFREKIGARYEGRMAVDYVFQSPDALPAGFAVPPGREKPWGTGHAVWCARDAVKENFAVINADDFYGADSFARLAGFLSGASVGAALRREESESRPKAAPAGVAKFSMVGFRLANTLSEHGAVSRGVCVADAAGALRSITEHTGILASEVVPGGKYSGAELVSMNCWGFTPDLFGALDRQLREFLGAVGAATPLSRTDTKRDGGVACPGPASPGPKLDPLKAEFYLPAAVSEQIARGQAVVSVLPTSSAWFGVTYREDKEVVQASIADLIARGDYPESLWAK